MAVEEIACPNCGHLTKINIPSPSAAYSGFQEGGCFNCSCKIEYAVHQEENSFNLVIGEVRCVWVPYFEVPCPYCGNLALLPDDETNFGVCRYCRGGIEFDIEGVRLANLRKAHPDYEPPRFSPPMKNNVASRR